MNFILLTHERELAKKTGTGVLVKNALKDTCRIITWSRTEPDPFLVNLSLESTLLIYPSEYANKSAMNESIELQHLQYETFVIIDGTWQEAKKIYNRSPYLHALQHYTLEVDYSSRYTLRRNQKNIGLCTAEVVLELLKQQKKHQDFAILDNLFTHFLQKN